MRQVLWFPLKKLLVFADAILAPEHKWVDCINFCEKWCNWTVPLKIERCSIEDKLLVNNLYPQVAKFSKCFCHSLFFFLFTGVNNLNGNLCNKTLLLIPFYRGTFVQVKDWVWFTWKYCNSQHVCTLNNFSKTTRNSLYN